MSTASILMGTAALAAILPSCIVSDELGRNEEPFRIGPIPRGHVDLTTHTIRGAPNGGLGRANAIVGDLDGDGFDDMLLADGESDGGTTYLFYGRSSFAVDLSVSEADASIDSGAANVGRAGDLDGDGLADATFVGSHGGAAHVLYGSRERLSGHHEAAAVTTTIETASQRCSNCIAMRTAGDVNGDGFDDLLVSQEHVATAEVSIHLVHGGPVRFSERYALVDAQAHFTGSRGASAFRMQSVAAGDVNGDGFGDVLLHTNNGSSQHLELFYGSADDLIGDMSSVGPAARFAISSYPVAVDPLGDLDGDGLDEISIVTGLRASVLYGRIQKYSGSFSVDDAALSLTPESSYGAFHFGGAATGDLDGDGTRELIIGDPFEDRNGSQTGALYMLLGAPYRFEEDRVLSETNAVMYGSDPVVGPDGLVGNAELLGYGVASGGDINGDGYEDALVGAPGNVGDGWGSSVYVLLGGPRISDDVELD